MELFNDNPAFELRERASLANRDRLTNLASSLFIVCVEFRGHLEALFVLWMILVGRNSDDNRLVHLRAGHLSGLSSHRKKGRK